MREWRGLGLLSMVMVGAASCGTNPGPLFNQTSASSSTGAGGGHTCTPGAQVSCACPGGEASGVQVCKQDGTGLGPCVCGGQGGASSSSSASASASTGKASSSSTGGMGGGASSSSSAGTGGGASSSSSAGTGGGASSSSSVASSSSGNVQGFDVEPSPLQTVNVTVGTTPPTVSYTATFNGQPASTSWSLDQNNLGSLSTQTGSSVVFTPSGNAGGLVTISAALNGMTLQRQVMIKLSATQNGATPGEGNQVATSTGSLTAGGGIGGVGGTGLGPPIGDTPTLMALGNPTGNGQAQQLAFVYPYDKTVWPRGLQAPLLQWTWLPPGGPAYPGDADAIQITLSTADGSFSYKGTFARPAILSTFSGSFINHPVPQDIWDMATNSASGTTNQLTVSLVVAKGGVAYGPITETWTIAPARLGGTIYYNSYGTALVHNFFGAAPGGGLFGGAVLSMHVGDTGPKVVGGGTIPAETDPNAPNSALCRACHSVAAFGSQLVAQRGDSYVLGSAYTLSPAGNTETMFPNGSPNTQFPAVYPDGSMALTDGGQLIALPMGTPLTTATGLPAGNLGYPAFSPEGTTFAYHQGQKLYVTSFNKATLAFGTATLVADDSAQASAAVAPGWPAFFPDGKSVIYHHQTIASVEAMDVLATREGSHAQVYWTSTKSSADAMPLANLNGQGYLPKLPTPSTLSCYGDNYQVAGGPAGSAGPGVTTPNANLDHGDDVDMNYEPTANPIASGGYAWVVFTSRRMYGNVATIPPFCSDPRGVDLTPNASNPQATNITTKKLWVAAVDLTQAPGADSSHPAFYLPAQELLAANGRGFWALDPCQASGASCTTGDQCCTGFCEPNGTGGALICSSSPPASSCSGLQEKCAVAADCCDATNVCLDGFCAQKQPG